ncbi:hypothetical protein JOD82_002074 [Paenibacillus sp. 1182]|uniref:hypothetical protein n=1 Tax=Paenibacillus sp. 1182 TaxID=2806565 RepID=UPI001AE6AC1D|nr:hypothetical protein [Paenibacillus sp. 1182]MBP1309054.1 hypothetical protein [Paenibacillus sp. 1182]
MIKAQLTQAQATALDSLKKLYPDSDIVKLHAKHQWSNQFESIQGLPLDTLIRALYHDEGYEVI